MACNVKKKGFWTLFIVCEKSVVLRMLKCGKKIFFLLLWFAIFSLWLQKNNKFTEMYLWVGIYGKKKIAEKKIQKPGEKIS